MQKIVNFIRGTVRLELKGAFPERFLNICAAENLPFWQVEQPDEHTLRITLAGQDRRRAVEAAKRSLCQVTEVGREGIAGLYGALPQALRPAHGAVLFHRRRSDPVPVHLGH